MAKKKINWKTHPRIHADLFEGVVQVDIRRIKEGHYFSANDHQQYELITNKSKTEFETIQVYENGIRCSKFFPIRVENISDQPKNLFYRAPKFVFPESDPIKYKGLEGQLRDMGLGLGIDDSDD